MVKWLWDDEGLGLSSGTVIHLNRTSQKSQCYDVIVFPLCLRELLVCITGFCAVTEFLMLMVLMWYSRIELRLLSSVLTNFPKPFWMPLLAETTETSWAFYLLSYLVGWITATLSLGLLWTTITPHHLLAQNDAVWPVMGLGYCYTTSSTSNWFLV